MFFADRRSFSSGKFEFVSGKCQEIFFFPFCMNPGDKKSAGVIKRPCIFIQVEDIQ